MEWSEFVNKKPFLTTANILKILRNDYGITTEKHCIVNLYANQIFLVDTRDVAGTGPEGPRKRFVLKVLSSTFTNYVDEIRASTELMSHFHKLGLNGQLPVRNKRGEILKLIRLPTSEDRQLSGRESITPKTAIFITRLFNYAEGQLLSSFGSFSDDVLIEVGSKMARMHLASMGAQKQRQILEDWSKFYVWSLERMSSVRDILHVVHDPQKLQLIERVTEAFMANVACISDQLPKGFIHNDIKGDNIVIQPESNASRPSITIIDFDDALYSCLIYDIAVTVKYLLHVRADVTPFRKGYEKYRRWTVKENSALFYCVTARLAMELVGNQYMAMLSSQHLSYLDQDSGWGLLSHLWQIGAIPL